MNDLDNIFIGGKSNSLCCAQKSIGAKPTHIIFDKVDGYIKKNYGTK